jgi:hypothetical protein
MYGPVAAKGTGRIRINPELRELHEDLDTTEDLTVSFNCNKQTHAQYT